jgi:hypothetical protein
MNSLAGLLNQWTSDTLKKYVSLLGGNSSLTRKDARINFIVSKMLDKEALRTVWEALDPISQRAVSTAYHNGGVFDARAFRAQYDHLPPRPKPNRWAYYQEPILFDLFVIEGQVPEDLMPLLEDLVLPPERFKLEGTDSPPDVVDLEGYMAPVLRADTEITGQADLLAYLQLVDQGALNWTSAKKLLTSASTRKVLDHLLEGDFREEPTKLSITATIRPMGLDIFSRESGLVSSTGRLTATGRKYLQSQDPDLMLEAFERWSEKGGFDELTRVTALKGLTSARTRLTPPASRRSRVIEALSWCPANRWIHVKDFYRALVIWQFDFDVESGPYSNLTIGSYYDGDYISDSTYWFITKGLYINAIIWEVLGSIGAVDVASTEPVVPALEDDEYYEDDYYDEPYSPHEGLIAFRINNWGAFLLGQAGEYVPTRPRDQALFRIDTERRVHLLSDLLPNERLRLDMMAEVDSDGRYRLDSSKLLSAVEAGQKLPDLIAFLKENHDGEMPGEVATWLERLRKNQGLFEERGYALLVRAKRVAQMELMREDEVLSKLCKPVDDTTVVVYANHEKRFRARLKELGYLL